MTAARKLRQGAPTDPPKGAQSPDGSSQGLGEELRGEEVHNDKVAPSFCPLIKTKYPADMLSDVCVYRSAQPTEPKKNYCMLYDEKEKLEKFSLTTVQEVWNLWLNRMCRKVS